MLDLHYEPSLIPAELGNTCVELAWRAADLAGENADCDDLISLAGGLLAAEAWQVQLVEAFAIELAHARCTAHQVPSSRWAYWQRSLEQHEAQLLGVPATNGRMSSAVWVILSQTAQRLTSPIDLEIGLAGGFWRFVGRGEATPHSHTN